MDLLKEKNKKYDLIMVIGAIVFGYLIHGAFIFDRQLWHDDVCSMGGISPSYSIAAGHWFRALVNIIIKNTIGLEQVISVTAFISFTCIALIGIVLFREFQIHSNVLKMLLLWYMLSNVAVLSNLGYIDCMSVNYITVLYLTVITIKLFHGILDGSKAVLLLGVAIVPAIGVYQCYFAYYISLVLLLFINDILKNKNYAIKHYFKNGIIILLISVGIIIAYVISVELSVKITGISISSYGHADTYGIVGVNQYIERICFAYKQFFVQTPHYAFSEFPFKWRWGIYVIIIIGIGLSISLLFTMIKHKEVGKLLSFGSCVILWPLAINLIYVLYGMDVAHGLHTFNSIFILYFVVVVLQNSDENWIRKISYRIIIVAMVLLNIMFYKYDNLCYTSIKLANEKTVNFLNRIIAEVEMQDGYSKDMPIYIANSDKLADYGKDTSPLSSLVYTDPYFITTLSYSTNDYIHIHVTNDFFVRIFEEDTTNTYDISAMPSYPTQGSITIIDGKVIIKL